MRRFFFSVLVLAFVFTAWSGAALAQESDPALLAQYKAMNEKYFLGKLPTANVSIFWDSTIPKSDMCGTWIIHWEGEPEKIYISCSPFFKDCESCIGLSMLHEMVHIKLRHRNIPKSELHGKEFQKEMLRLAKKGAFAKYW